MFQAAEWGMKVSRVSSLVVSGHARSRTVVSLLALAFIYIGILPYNFAYA